MIYRFHTSNSSGYFLICRQTRVKNTPCWFRELWYPGRKSELMIDRSLENFSEIMRTCIFVKDWQDNVLNINYSFHV